MHVARFPGPLFVLVIFRAAIDQLREAADFTIGSLVLVKECEPVLFEAVEKLFPRDLLKAVLAGKTRVIDSQKTGTVFTFSSLHSRRMSTAFFNPLLDLFVISCAL